MIHHGPPTLALATLLAAGCGDGLCHQGDVSPIAVPPGSRLNAVALGYFAATLDEGSMLAVGDDGLVLTADLNYQLRASRPVTADLHDVTYGPSGQRFAVGAGGTLIRGLVTDDTWQPVATATTADLWRVAWLRVGTAWLDGSQDREYVIAVGDEVVLVRDPVDAGWDLVTPPPGGWGQLRAVVADDRIHVGGLGGVLWSADDPRGPWTRQDIGTTADLLAAAWDYEALLVGTRGTVVTRRDGAWVVVETGLGDLIDFTGVYGLAADGQLYRLSPPEEPLRLGWTAPGARALADDVELVAVGDDLALRAEAYCGR